MKYTKQYLNKLEELFTESDFLLRYEKGHFKSGQCILYDEKLIIINKYFTTEGKINCLTDIIRNLDLNTENMSDKSKKLYEELKQTALKF